MSKSVASSICFHSNGVKDFEVRAYISMPSVVKTNDPLLETKPYPVVQLRAENSDIMIFPDMEQVKELHDKLGKLMEEWSAMTVLTQEKETVKK